MSDTGDAAVEGEAIGDGDVAGPDDPDGTDDPDGDLDREDERAHLDDVDDGCGCAEVWEHLSEQRGE